MSKLGDSKDSDKNITLVPGDIIFEMIVNQSQKNPFHSWIHGDDKADILHAAEGNKLEGVTRHQFKHYVGETNVIILRCRDEGFKKLVIQIAKTWAPFLDKDELKQITDLKIINSNPLKKNAWGSTGIPFTPYSIKRNVTTLTSLEIVAILNIFRAVRAALRTGITKTDEIKIAPLSKIKGVNCNQFISFCIQAAAVFALLGENVEDLRPLVNQISKIGLKNCLNSSTGLKLLNQFNKSFLKIRSQTGEPEGLNADELMQIIQYSAKGSHIKIDLNFWLSLSLFTKIDGLLIISEKTQPIVLMENKPPKSAPLTSPPPPPPLPEDDQNYADFDAEEVRLDEEKNDQRLELFEDEEDSPTVGNPALFRRVYAKDDLNVPKEAKPAAAIQKSKSFTFGRYNS